MPLPPSKRLSIDDVFDTKGKPRPDVLKQHFVLEGRISDECALKIINDATAILRAEKTMLDIEAPVTGTPGPPDALRVTPPLWPIAVFLHRSHCQF